MRGEGGDVGPDLGFIAKTRDRAYLLESILMPNVTIAPGYENLMLTLGDGNLIAGTLMVETESELTVTQLADGKKVTVPKATVTQREKMPSSMPEGLGFEHRHSVNPDLNRARVHC